MVIDCLPVRCLACKDRTPVVYVSHAKVSHKSETACPFKREETIINQLIENQDMEHCN